MEKISDCYELVKGVLNKSSFYVDSNFVCLNTKERELNFSRKRERICVNSAKNYQSIVRKKHEKISESHRIISIEKPFEDKQIFLKINGDFNCLSLSDSYFSIYRKYAPPVKYIGIWREPELLNVKTKV